MTLLEINLTDVLSETDPDDRVIVWAPVMREGPAGQLVGPRRKTIPLVDGVGADEVVPGPLMVQVQCKALSDTRPREVVVPETGPVTLTALFDSSGAFTYSPAVVGQVAQYRNEAIQAAADAETAATTVGEHATQTADDRRQTGEDRTQTGLDRQAAAQSATDAATSATTAEGHKTTVQTALAGARLYSGTGFPNGVVAAPVGSIYTDTLATAGAIRWIKTSGTGNTGWQVEYGDTGWRDVSGMLLNGWGGNLFVRRVGSLVSYRGRLLSASATTSNAWDIPNGFRIGILLAAAGYDYGTAQVWTDENLPTIRRMSFYFDRFSLNGYQAGEDYVVGLSYTSTNSWPSVLPGTPA